MNKNLTKFERHRDTKSQTTQKLAPAGHSCQRGQVDQSICFSLLQCSEQTMQKILLTSEVWLGKWDMARATFH